MTTVANLVAKLGFQVDTRGFDNFKKSLQAFQSIVRDGIKDLKEYAKQAERISKAFKEAYVPSYADAEKRYRAESYAMRARAYAQRIRAKNLPETLAIRRYNAEIRDRQTSLKEAGLAGAGRTGGALLSILGMLSGGVGGVISGGLTALGSAIGGPVGAAVALAISKLMGSLLRGILAIGRTIVSQMKQAVSYVMAFRDYKSFTGRSHRGLGGLMEMTKWTRNMSPEDVMKDAERMGREYWDMWLGGGNPAFYQLLGLMPTSNGETNLKNVLTRIKMVAGNDRAKAASLLHMGNLSEDYLPILFDHWDEYKAKGGTSTFFDYSDERIRQMEKANEALRTFEMALNDARTEIISVLLDAGLQDALKTIVDWVKGFAQTLRDQGLWKALTNPSYNVYRGRTGDKRTVEQYNAATMTDWWKPGKEWSDFIPLMYPVNAIKRGLSYLFSDSLMDKAIETTAGGSARSSFSGTTINNFNNNVDMRGRDVEDGAKYNAVLNGEQIYQATLDAATIMARAQ